MDFSDHLNYWQRGFPAVMLTDTAFYRNKNYHTAGDTPEKLDYERMADVVRGIYYLITTYR
jgi:Zn-dependent M28 family amino/carboxypeptidase